MSHLTAAALLAVLAGAGAMPARAQTSPSASPQAFGLADDRAASPVESLQSAPSQRLGVALGAVPQVALAPVDAGLLLREDAARARRDMNKVLRFGIGRAVRAAAQDGSWYRLADGGRLWALDVVSPGALGLRLHLADLRLPRLRQGAEIAVYAPDAPERVTLYAGDQPSLDGDLWTPTVFGERLRLEVRLPAGATETDSLPFTIDRLQHLYIDPIAKASGSCLNDVTCHPEWAQEARAVGGVGIVNQDSLYCTGQLLNTVAGDRTPYFLTANHCLSSQREARTAEIFWLFQTATCGGAPPSLAAVPHSSGATLVATGTASDFTLLMIEGTVPRNLFWAGWTAAPVPNGTASAGIHHPAGEFKRISFGDRAHNPVCGGTNANHVRINWTDGITLAGSSGSGLFRADTHQLYGQLHCGPSFCGADPEDLNDSFGAFAFTYRSIGKFLARGSDDVFEDADLCQNAGRFAPGTYRNLIVKSTDADWYRAKLGAGQTLTVTLQFTRDWGTLAARLFAGCGQPLLAVSDGTGNTRTLTYTNKGTAPVTVRWQVYQIDDTRNSYSMTVKVQ
jgi:lysyl endopeptidase